MAAELALQDEEDPEGALVVACIQSVVVTMTPFEDLAGRLHGLMIRFADRLPADQAQWLHHVTEVGEYGLAPEDMAGVLALS
jgi:hypothetical protein